MIASSPSRDTPDPAQGRTERRLRVLRELAELGMSLTRTLAARAAETADPDLVLAFTRIAGAASPALNP
jgi:hypothetical protein